MLFPFVVEPGDETHAFGVVFPDCPGCFSAGDTLEEACANAKEALEGWLGCVIADGEEIPQPSEMSEIAQIPEYKGRMIDVVDVDISRLSAV